MHDDVCQKRRRGRPAKPIKKIIVRPTGEGEQAILSGESYPMNLVPAKFGGMKIIFQDNLFDFHFNRRGIQFWRCVLHTENCSARLVVHVGRIYIVSNEHNHNKVKMDKVNQEQSAAGATITSSVQITSPVAVSEQSQPIERLSNEKIQSMFTMEIERNAENSKRFDEEHVSMEKHDSGNNVETCEIINLKEDLNRRLKLLQDNSSNDSLPVTTFTTSTLNTPSTVTSNITSNIVEYVSSIKGGFQLCFEGFPYTRHRHRDNTTYWRCVQFKPLGCKSRLRTKSNGQQLEIVDRHHNHTLQTERRKKGSLKAIYAERELQKPKKKLTSNVTNVTCTTTNTINSRTNTTTKPSK